MGRANGAQDVTNHQINHLTLIQSFVNFQQTEILGMISTGNIDIYESYAWFDSYRNPDDFPALSREGGIWKFFRGFVDLLRHSNREAPIPDTLELDSERIADLRTNLLDAVNLNICMNFFNVVYTPVETIISPNTPHASPQAQSGSNTSGQNHRFAHVHSALPAIVDDYLDPDVDPSSPPNSLPSNYDPWKAAAPALTLEMLRNANAPLYNPYFEKSLTERLSNPSSEDFVLSELTVFRRVGRLIRKYVDAWEPLDSVALYKVAPVCPQGCKIHNKPKEIEPLDEIARRIAHLGILHWNVWGKIVYLVDPNEHPNRWSEDTTQNFGL